MISLYFYNFVLNDLCKRLEVFMIPLTDQQLNILLIFIFRYIIKIVSEYNQEIPQSQTADNPIAPRGRAAKPSRDSRKTN